MKSSFQRVWGCFWALFHPPSLPQASKLFLVHGRFQGFLIFGESPVFALQWCLGCSWPFNLPRKYWINLGISGLMGEDSTPLQCCILWTMFLVSVALYNFIKACTFVRYTSSYFIFLDVIFTIKIVFCKFYQGTWKVDFCMFCTFS